MFWRKIILFFAVVVYFFPIAVLAAGGFATEKQNTADMQADIQTAEKYSVECAKIGCAEPASKNCSAPLKNSGGNFYCLNTPCVNGDTCKFVDKTCNKDEDCQGYALKGGEKCFKNYCYLDALGVEKFNKNISIGITDLKVDLQIKKPLLNIKIPGLNFSDLSNNTISEENGKAYLSIPYIGEYLSAAYKFGLVAISIIAVVMIIITGIKIIVTGGQGQAEGFKRIGQIMIGLFIGWGSYTILSIVNPALVNFKALRVEYIEKQDIPDYLTHGEEVVDGPVGKTGKKHAEPSGQTWTIPGTSIIVPLSQEDVCALQKLGKDQQELASNITTVKFLGCSISVHKFIAIDLQDRLNALESSTDPSVVAWRNHLKDPSQNTPKNPCNLVSGSGAFMPNGHGSAVAFIKKYGPEVGVELGKGGLANTALANYIKLKLSQQSGSNDGTYTDKNGVTRKMKASPTWIASGHALGLAFDIDYPHNQTFKTRNELSIPDAAGNILEATGKFVWLKKADPAHIEYSKSLCE